MTRPLAEVEAEAALVRKRRETFDSIVNGGLSAEEEQLAREQLAAIGTELDALASKNAPPPLPPVVKDIASVSPADAAKRAGEIAADRRFWDPRAVDKDGVRLTPEQHDRLVRERSELLGRAAGGGGTP